MFREIYTEKVARNIPQLNVLTRNNLGAVTVSERGKEGGKGKALNLIGKSLQPSIPRLEIKKKGS